MAHATTVDGRSVFGNKNIVFASINITSYTTGGEVMNAGTDFGLMTIDTIMVTGYEDEITAQVTPEVSATGAYEAANIIHLFAVEDDGTSGVPAEVASTTDIGFVKVMVIGTRR